MSFIGATWARIPRGIQTIIIAAAVLFGGLLIWQFGAQMGNRIGSWWFQRGVRQEQKELQDSKALAADLLKQLQAEKEVTAAERAKREIAERILSDASKNTAQKLAAYERETQRVIVPSAPLSDDELCARAKRLGLGCGEQTP